jgi:6-phosphogluconolactonase
MSISVYSKPEELSEAAANLFVDIAIKSVKINGKFTAALSGGGSPQRLYELLASEPFRDRIPWDNTFIFWGDERFVPFDDPENNARMCREKLLEHVPIPSDHIFPVPTSGEPEEAVAAYTSTLSSFFGESNAFPCFDFMLLGLGENGHTASLFPEKDVLAEKEKWVGSIYLEDKDQHRITLTYPVINNALNVIFLVHGSNKANVLHEILEGPQRPKELPAQDVKSKNGSLLWLIDEDAAAKLDIPKD